VIEGQRLAAITLLRERIQMCRGLRLLAASILVSSTGLTLLPGTARASGPSTTRVSISTRGVQGDDFSLKASISADGRFVAFGSHATNLVSGDTNGVEDVFVRDRKLNKTTRVSIGTGGTQGDSASYSPSISADGRSVTFASDATNLAPGDTNAHTDVFVRDRKLHRTRRVSLNTHGTQGNDSSYSPSISADGLSVAFVSDATNLVSGDTNARTDVFIRDLKLRRTRRVSINTHGTQGNDSSYSPIGPLPISATGRFVVFVSDATNLVSGDTNGYRDVFVRDRKLNKTTRVSISTHEVQANGESIQPSISADGRFIAFSSGASNLVSSDTNAAADVFVRDRKLKTTRLVSVNNHGVPGNDASYQTAISADGRFIGFGSVATNLVPGDTNGFADVFVRGPLG
jgi:Tol biopolymer transport system component